MLARVLEDEPGWQDVFRIERLELGSDSLNWEPTGATSSSFGFERGVEGTNQLRSNEGGVMAGERDKVEGELKEEEGKLTDDELREKQGQAQQKWGEAKDELEDTEEDVRERT
jgi:uncharacterized protein YjbJ (UPF0337 family)